MKTDISQFDYQLPTRLISQSPTEPRENGRLLFVSKDKNKFKHLHIKDFPLFFHPHDVLVLNNTKVFKARLHGICDNTQKSTVELFLVRPLSDTIWQAIGKPWKKFSPGTTVTINPNFIATIQSIESNGTINICFNKTIQQVIDLANIYGTIPLPPYIKHPTNPESYQTSYATIVGSVAAPTAGFHVTQNLLERLKQTGVIVCEITLHVGLGTFKTVKTKTIEEHTMHSEWVSISKETAEIINTAKNHRKKIIAVGTTTVRTLEGVASLYNGHLKAYEGDINLFITPGFHFNIIDGLLTNFHLPKSTLLILVSAFAGRIKILQAYENAIQNNYRFYSFGDAMIII